MTTPLADAASAWTFFGGLIVGVGTVVVFLSFLVSELNSKLKWSDNAGILGTLAIGLGTAIALIPLFSEYTSEHKTVAFTGAAGALLVVVLVIASAWRSWRRGQ